MAWWWTVLYLFHKRVKALLESAGLDVEKLPPPKSIWFDDDALKQWFEDRTAMQREKWKQDS